MMKPRYRSERLKVRFPLGANKNSKEKCPRNMRRKNVRCKKSGGEFRSLENANDQYNCGFAVMPSFGGDVKSSVPCRRKKKHGYLSRGEGHVPVPCLKSEGIAHFPGPGCGRRPSVGRSWLLISRALVASNPGALVLA